MIHIFYYNSYSYIATSVASNIYLASMQLYLRNTCSPCICMHTDVAIHACMHDIALNTVKVKIKVSLHGTWEKKCNCQGTLLSFYREGYV